jgi:hypothetical protein
LTDDAYNAGLRRIEATVAEGETTSEEVVFTVDLALIVVSSWVRGGEETTPLLRRNRQSSFWGEDGYKHYELHC